MATVRGLCCAVVGGERRELEAARALVEAGVKVHLAGFPAAEVPGAVACAAAAGAVAGAPVVLLPVRGLGPDGGLPVLSGPPLYFDDAALDAAAGALLLIGIATPALREACARRGIRLVEFRERDEFAIPNAVPTAEGAIGAAIAALDVTLHGCRAVVTGYGRTGRALARRLHALGAVTTVVARRGAARAEARGAGLEAAGFDALAEAVAASDVVFNTVPALVLGRPVLARARAGTPVFDVASSPGGTDFVAARELGLRARLLPGLPGRVAPRTAGRILAETVLRAASEERTPPARPQAGG